LKRKEAGTLLVFTGSKPNKILRHWRGKFPDLGLIAAIDTGNCFATVSRIAEKLMRHK
jgi:hypothetical protein